MKNRPSGALTAANMNDNNIKVEAVVIQLCVTALSSYFCSVLFPLLVSHPSKEGLFAAVMWFGVMAGILSGPIIRKYIK